MKIAKRTRLPAILSVQNKWLLHLFCQFCYQGAELMEYYSVHSGIRIEYKNKHNYCQFCVFSFQNSPKRTCPTSPTNLTRSKGYVADTDVTPAKAPANKRFPGV